MILETFTEKGKVLQDCELIFFGRKLGKGRYFVDGDYVCGKCYRPIPVTSPQNPQIWAANDQCKEFPHPSHF